MKYRKKEDCEGRFETVTFDDPLHPLRIPKSYTIRYDYLGKYIALLAEGYAQDRVKFASLDLCFNQTEVARTLDYFCDEAYNEAPGQISEDLTGDAKTLGDKLQDFMDALDDGEDTKLDDAKLYDIEGSEKIFMD